jgi:hypothetical protein
MALRSRIFLSCGQRPDEVTLVNQIKERIENELHFEVYIARLDHSINSLTENIFSRLEHSEYYLFIDFKREHFDPAHLPLRAGQNQYRGSLFTNQELAIAAYIKDIDILGFQEEGVLPLDGMMNYLQLNCDVFRTRDELPNLIIRRIQEEGWRNNWRNELVVNYINDRDIPALRPEIRNDQQVLVPYTFRHFRVTNLNDRKIALNCIAYIDNIETDGVSWKPSISELKWRNIISPNILIPPKETRELDAYSIPEHREFVMLGLNTHIVDYTGLVEEYKLRNGTHVITFIIYSENFSPVKIRIRLTKINRTITCEQI